MDMSDEKAMDYIVCNTADEAFTMVLVLRNPDHWQMKHAAVTTAEEMMIGLEKVYVRFDQISTDNLRDMRNIPLRVRRPTVPLLAARTIRNGECKRQQNQALLILLPRLRHL